MEQDTISYLNNKITIDTKLNWIISEFKFTKLTLNKNLVWELILDLHSDLDRVDMSYECSFILNPNGFNDSLKTNFNNFKNPQRSLTDTDETFIKRCDDIHTNYLKESKSTWSINFIADVSKYETKSKTNQIKLTVPKDVAEFIMNKTMELTNKDDRSNFWIVFINKD